MNNNYENQVKRFCDEIGIKEIAIDDEIPYTYFFYHDITDSPEIEIVNISKYQLYANKVKNYDLIYDDLMYDSDKGRELTTDEFIDAYYSLTDEELNKLIRYHIDALIERDAYYNE